MATNLKNELTTYIKSFQILNEDEVKLIVDSSDVRAFKKGTILVKEGDIVSNCYFILKGCIREYIIKDGVEKSTAFYIEGDSVVSFTSATNKTPSKHFQVCAEDCVLTVGNESLENEMCEKIPRLKTIIHQETVKVTGQTKDDFAAFVTSSPEDRYKNLLENKPTLLERVPLHQIASYLGVTPESLSRIRKRINGKK